jgi:hypothetical protein
MGVDQAAVPAIGQGVKYIRAVWDVFRDGGGVEVISIPSQVMPASAFVFAFAWTPIESMVDLGDSLMTIKLGLWDVVDSQNVAGMTSYYGQLPYPGFPRDGGSYPITLGISGDGYSSGSLYIYLFYV